MSKKPTYEELEQRVEEFENETTELKRVEEALRESEGKFRMLSDQALLGIIILQEELFVYVNDRAAAIMEVTAEEVANWSLGEYAKLIHPDDLAFVMEQGRKKQTGEKGAVIHYNWRMVTPGGNLKWVETWSKTIPFASRTADMVTMIDITERKLAEEALRESEEKFRHLVKNSNDVFVIIDENGKEIFVSDSVERITGFTPAETMEHSGFEFLHPDDVDHMSETLSKLLETPGITIRDEYRHRRKEGGWVYLEAMGTNYLHEPSVGGIVLNIRNITERKQAEEALRESEEKYRNVFNNAQVGIFRTRISDGKVLECNDRFARTYGYRTPEECINDFVVSEHYTDPGAREKMMASLMEKGEVNDIEACFSRKDGEEAWIRFSARAYPEGGYLEGVGYDITEEKRALEALQQGEEKYRQLSDSLPQIVFETNEKDNLTFTNRMAFDILGYTKEDFEKGLNALQMLIPEDHDRALKNIQRVLKGEKLGGTEYTALTKDGRRYPAMVYSTPIISEGKSVGMRGIVTDLTEVKRTQKALLESEEKLARSNKMEAMGLMAGGVAHDLNNILSGIVSYPELLLLDLPEDSPLRNPIKTIQESGMRAADVVEDLLTIARGVATGNEVLNLNTIVEEYINSAEHQKLEKTHPLSTFKTDLDSELLNITGSASHVKKILMNLTVNASEAIEGSGTVTISTTNQYLDEPLKGYEDVRIGEYVLLSISDDGSGISPQDLDKIFEPFYTKKVMGRSGTGLGLAVVWNSMQDHNGYINVRSSEKGTVFELYFPTTREQVADEGEQVPLEDYLGHGEKILVVDDEERQREIACGMLAKLGYNAEAVSSGEEAIEYVKDHSVDLIVLDMVMPKGINGRKTYEQIIKIRPGQKAIIASGYAKTKEVDTAQELGAGKYIKKPYILEKIGIAVKEDLEK